MDSIATNPTASIPASSVPASVPASTSAPATSPALASASKPTSESRKEWVKKLLSDDKVNVGILPDSMEAALYEKILNATSGIAEHAIKTSSATIEIAGDKYRLSFKLEKLNE